MKKTNSLDSSESSPNLGKILLLLLPFWDPQIPPLGIACLTSYLRKYNYTVKAVDGNLEFEFRKIYDSYFHWLERYIPGDRKGNLYNIGNQVLRNHMMAHLNHTDENNYIKLVKMLVFKTFYWGLDDSQVFILKQLLDEFYGQLRTYILDLLERERPSVLGLSVYGDTLPASLFAFKLAKEKLPFIKTVMGGGIFADQLAPGSPELDFFVEKTSGYIDKFMIGEGEQLLLKFLKGELNQTQKVYSLNDCPSGILDISAVDVPDFSDFDLQYYPHLAHYGARSCPFQCRFCSETINWGKYRKKDVAQTVREFIELNRRYSYQLFLLTDSTLNPIATELAREIIKSDVSIYWDGFLRADKHVCNTENTLLWRRGGFYRAKLGLESGSQHILDLMDKRITVEQSEKALASLAYAGIKTTTFWLFGYPGETEEDFQMTLDFIDRCKDYIYEADCNAFNYYLTGQANSQEWMKNNKGVLLYPPWAKDMLITQTWIMDCEPSREAAYERVNRFMAHCKKLGIPNPYSLKEIYKADERWRNLHKNAVPPLVELRNSGTYIEENRDVKELSFAQNTIIDEDEWL